VQTLAGKFLRRAPSMDFERRRVETPDGDFLDVDVGPDPGGNAPTALVLHGLEGSSRRPYVLLACHALARQGIAPVALNFRSCSGEPNRRARSYHSGDTGDLEFILGTLSDWFPRRPAGVVGFSLGGNVLLKFLGESGTEARRLLRAAAAISVPYDLAAGAEILERGPMGRLYTHYFLRSLKEKSFAKRDLLEGQVDLNRVRLARTLRDFDEAVTAPVHGFRDATHYYEDSSCASFLGSIRLPTLLLHSRDDPFLPEECLPGKAVADDNPFLATGFTSRGGHVGFVQGSLPWSLSFWAEEQAARFLRHHLISSDSGALSTGADAREEDS
jgi:predicted alpha/beta-fold hydrolase